MWEKLGPEQPSAGRKVCTSWGGAAFHQGLTYLTVLGIFHLSSPLHLSWPCSVSQGGWPVRTVSLGFPVLWCPLGFSQWGALAGDQREGKCEFPVLPPYWFTAGWLSPHQWMTHVSPATWPSPNSYSLWVPVTAFLLCLFRQVKGWQRVPTIASPRIPHHPSLVSLTSAGTTENSPFIKVSVAREWMWCWLLARTQTGKLTYFMVPITTYILL